MFESLLKYIVRSVLQKVIYEGFFLSYLIAFLTLHFRCSREFGACMRVYERKRKEYKGRLKRDGNHHTRNGKCATSQPR